MKFILILFSGCILILFPGYAPAQGAFTTSSHDSTVTFKVFGVCVQCKHRIEEAVKGKGVKSADWNANNKMLYLTYDPSRVNLDKIHNRITAVGHDTYLKKASDAVYNALPSCCHYREMESMDDMGKPGVKNSLPDSVANMLS